MPEFTVTGEIDPFLHVTLQQGEKIYAESDAMVTMDATLELTGKMRGGFFSSIARSFTAGESFFQQSIEANRGGGDVLLAPGTPGGVQLLEIGAQHYLLNDGAFLAADDKVSLTVRSQGIGNAIFGGTGGLFVLETGGIGKIAVCGFGSLFELDIDTNVGMIVDNHHVVAWDSSLQYEISTATNDTGFFSGMINSVKSGEGFVTKFRGKGKVVICSRNKPGFASFLGGLMGK
ncbi:MAG: TIGR00266 family protein [Pseudomonadota bacterium]